MNVRLGPASIGNQFRVIYRPSQYSFAVEPQPTDGFTSCLLNDLQLEIDDTGKVLYPWGFFPLPSKCEPTAFDGKNSRQAVLTIERETEWIPGVSVRLNPEPWPIYYDELTGWMGTSDMGNCESLELIEFAPQCIAAIANNAIHGVWIRPDIE